MANPVMRPVMNCCKNPDPKWMKRDPETKEIVHAYVCANCGREDRIGV